MDFALQHVVTDGTGTRAQAVGRPVAGKTGTTDSNLSAWFVGYTPQMSTAVVMFRTGADGRTRESLTGAGGGGRVNGGSFPTAIWTAYTRAALKGTPVRQVPDRPGAARADCDGDADADRDRHADGVHVTDPVVEPGTDVVTVPDRVDESVTLPQRAAARWRGGSRRTWHPDAG